MIVLSFLLVIVAAVTLVIGLFQGDNLLWIWVSIGSCVVAMLFLGIGVLQRRSARPQAETDSGYGPGAISGLLRDEREEEEKEEAAAEEEDVVVVPKRTVSDAREEVGQPEAAAAPAETAAPAVEERAAAAEEAEEEVTEPAPTVETQAEEPETAPAQETTGAPARRELARIKGLGEAKQKALLDHFGSLEAIQAASVSELQQVKGFGSTIASQVHAQLASGDGGATPAMKTSSRTKKSSPARKAAKKATKRAAKKTTGASARKALAEVKGLGPSKQKALLDRFGSLEAIRDASVTQLLEVKGIGESTAKEIQKQLS